MKRSLLIPALSLLFVLPACDSGDDHCSAGAQVSGSFSLGAASLDIDESTDGGMSVEMEHKIDIDIEEAGCIGSADIVIRHQDLGCQLRLGLDSPEGLLRLSSLSFDADSYCPDFPDAVEGHYSLSDVGTMQAEGLPSRLPLSTGIEETFCLQDEQFRIAGNGMLQLDDDGLQRAVDIDLTFTGDFLSSGSTDVGCRVDDDDAVDACAAAVPCTGDYIIENIIALDEIALCESISGDLTLDGQEWLTNLDDLSCLTSVGALYIYENDALTDLSGLSNLTTVGGGLSINSNAALTNLDGLSNLTSVGGLLNINGNDALADISDLSNLTSVGRGLNIQGNTALTDISGLSSLVSVGGLFIFNNSALTGISGLSSLTSVGGNLTITSNPALTNLDGLSGITSVGGHLTIYENTVLPDISGLSSITTVGGDLYIFNNPVLCQSLVDAFVAACSCGTVVDITGNDDGC